MTTQADTPSWFFVDATGTFRLDDPQHTSYLYFPLVNEAGMMSVVTPTLHGDCKTGQHDFLLRRFRLKTCMPPARRATSG